MAITFNFKKAEDLFNKVLPKCIPSFQLENLKNGVLLNPKLSITPQEWFLNSYEWFFPLEILPELEYGPFFRVDGKEFWPQIGSQDDIYSEKKCFYAFRKPKDVDEVKKLLGIKDENTMEYIYEFRIKIQREDFFRNPLMFIGPIRNAEGFQANPNTTTAKIIQMEIMNNNSLVRYKKLSNGKYSEDSEQYKIKESLICLGPRKS